MMGMMDGTELHKQPAVTIVTTPKRCCIIVTNNSSSNDIALTTQQALLAQDEFLNCQAPSVND